MKRRVVVTGLGAVTPIGNDVESFWSGVKEGKVGIGPITRFDTTGYKATLAAELKDFVAKDRMDPRTARRMEPFSQYAVAAALEAVEHAGLKMEEEDPYMVGVIIGSGVGSLQATETNEKKLVEKGPSRVDPLLVPKMITNMAAGNVSIATGAKGKCTNVVTACATGTHCIGDAFRAIQYGDADVMLAGGTEGAICPIGIAGFASLTALSTSEDPLRASIPFDKSIVFQQEMDIDSCKLVCEDIVKHPEITGMVVSADIMAAGIMAGLRSKGIRIPDDISIVGFDDISLAQLVTPPLTTIHQDMNLKGRLAVDFMLQLLDGKPLDTRDISLPTRLIERGSVRAL